jgi:hypothetical protein
MAAIIMVSVVVFAVQATSLTPLTSSTANTHIETQLQTMGYDIMDSLDHSEYGQESRLKTDLLDWSGHVYIWNGSSYVSKSNQSKQLNNSISKMLEKILIKRGIAHNMHFTYIKDDGNRAKSSYIYNGEPSDNAIIVSRKIVISNPDISDTSKFSSKSGIKDLNNSTDFYNIVDIQLTLWRI